MAKVSSFIIVSEFTVTEDKGIVYTVYLSNRLKPRCTGPKPPPPMEDYKPPCSSPVAAVLPSAGVQPNLLVRRNSASEHVSMMP